MKIKPLILVLGCAVLLGGCTKSNIVQPSVEPGETMGPDFNLYNDIELDLDQLKEDVEDIFLDASEYPAAAGLEFTVNIPEEYVDVTVIVKDGTSPEDAAFTAAEAVKIINDQVAVQDFGYAESTEDYFGGLYQDNVIRLKIYDESTHQAGGAPMFEKTVEKDAYEEFVIKK